MAEENVIRFKIETEDTSIEGTRKKIEALKSEMLSTTDTDTFNKLALQAGGLETEIRRVEDAVTSLAGSGSELTKMSNSFSRVGASLSSMDFGAAAEEAGRLAAISKTMNFGSAISSLKSLGSTFMSLGKALLTNPFFLLVAVITAIVVGIVKLMDELGILTAIFDAVGAAIGWVIQQIKDLLDWLGLTDYAGEEQAANQIERNNKLAESNKALTAELVGDLDHEIKMRQLAGEETIELERQKLEAIRESNAEQIRLAINTAQAMIKLHGADSEEFKTQYAAIQELKKAYIQSGREIEIFEAEQAKKEIDLLETTEKEKADKRKEWFEKRKAEEIARLDEIARINRAHAQFIADLDASIAAGNKKENDAILLMEQQIEAEMQAQMEREGAAADKMFEDEKKRTEAKLLLEQQLQDGKRALIDSSLNALGANLKEGSNAAKGVAVAQASIDTYRAATAAFASTAANPISIANPSAPFIAAAAAVALGIANVRKILATKADGSGGAPSGGASFSPPSLGGRSEGASTTPSMNLNNGVEQNAGGSVNRVTVVDYTDIEKKGKQVNMLQNRVSLI